MHLYRSFIRALIAVQIFCSEMHVGDFSRNLRVKEIHKVPRERKVEQLEVNLL